MPIKYRSIAFKPSATVAGLINKRTIAKNRLDLDISRISCIWLSLCADYSAICLSSGSLGFSWMKLSLNVDMFSCVWLSLYVGYSASYLSSGALGFLWMQLSLDANMLTCIWLSLYVCYSASYLSSGALGLSWMKLPLRDTCLVPFGCLIDAAIIGCRQGFIHMAFIVCGIFSKLLVFWSFGIFMDAAIIAKYRSMDSGQRATSTASFSVSLPITSFDGFRYCTTYWTLPFISIYSGKATIVDNPFNGHPATHACYWWIISATSKKQQ
ncbi:hypothetical protein O0I10_013157 [Lichtheimia ornata]|uniref:Uncharacterized protein n=1 Tax=Lichtheimia ornata TaxID=688661 RepID=A0AAD7USA6_9FUNG|nr:uncharacterized protein O0I10_013157 [Lichtheimia ornata]KAJ8651341.1 hypothetical protein O0I10_013157 [Lichtheimia ornata]